MGLIPASNNSIKLVTETKTSSQHGWIELPATTFMASALIDGKYAVFLPYTNGTKVVIKGYINVNNSNFEYGTLANNTSYAITYSYSE